MQVLGGCSSGWQAPLEVRGASPQPQEQEQEQKPLSGKTYKVEKGDTLFAIAWRAGKDFRQLASWNRIRAPHTIYPGQTLRLTPPPATSKKKTTKAAPPKKTTAKTSVKQSSKPTAKTVTGKQEPQAQTSGRLHWAWPTQGRVASTFSTKEQTRQGIKIAGKDGQAITAAEKGKIVYSGSGLIGYGRLIIIKHNDNYLSAYGHNRQLLVKEGDQVAKGDRIAEMGRSNDGKPMLHFEIRRVGKPVDPLPLLPQRKS